LWNKGGLLGSCLEIIFYTLQWKMNSIDIVGVKFLLGGFNMELKLKENGLKPKITFFNGLCQTEYQSLSNRWNEMLSIIYIEVFKYINNDDLCFSEEEDSGSFPVRNKLTGIYYMDSVSYGKHVNPMGFQIMVSTRFTENLSDREEDYLGLEVTLFTKSANDPFEVWGIDSSSI
jgi:hypothetical protein